VPVDAGRLLGLVQRRSVSFDLLPDRPDLLAVDGDALEQGAGQAGRGQADNGPAAAVPVLGQRGVGVLPAGLPDRPDVAGSGGGHAEQAVAGGAGIRGGYDGCCHCCPGPGPGGQSIRRR
jgi:hypothetical protein